LLIFVVIETLYKLEGGDSDVFRKNITKYVEELNKIGMQFVQHQDIETGQKILEFCEQCTQPGTYGEFPLLRNLTYNNLGCLYRRVGKNKLALSFLKRGLNILSQNGLMQHSAMTFLNLCAVVSQLGEYNTLPKLTLVTSKARSMPRMLSFMPRMNF
jgi:hypothetical protein